MLSHSLKTMGSVSKFVRKTTIKKQLFQHLYFFHSLHSITSNQSLPRIIQRSAVQWCCFSSKNKSSDDHAQGSTNGNSNLISNHLTTISFEHEQDLLLFLDQQLKRNSSFDDIEMMEQYLFDQHTLPGARSYQKVLDAWCKIKNFDRAKLLLNQIHHNYVNKKCTVAPNHHHFRNVLFAYAQLLSTEATIGRHHEYATKVETLIEKMKEWHDQFGYNTKPRQNDYEVLFQSMAYSDEPDPEKAEKIFRDMLKQYDDGNKALKPTTKHFGYVLRLWDLSPRRNTSNRKVAADRSLALYKEAKKRSIPLNCFSYRYLIDILYKCQQYEIAEALSNEMIRLFQAGDKSLKPTRKTMISMLHVRSKTGNPLGAQEVFTEMLKEWRLGDVNCKPNLHHFNLLLMAWYNSNRFYAAEKAHEWVSKLNHITAETDSSLRPDSVSYSIVIKCYYRSSHYGKWKRVVDLYQEAKAQKNLQPNLIFYLEVLAALMKSYTSHKNVVDGDDIVNDNTDVDAVVITMIKQILTNDVYDIPDSVWQRPDADGGGVWFCNSVSDMLQRRKVPDWGELLLHVETKLRPKCKC